MTTPLTTAEIVERLTTDSDLLDAWATWELGALPVPGPMNHADIATNLRTAASALLALEGERDAAIKDVFRMASAELTAFRSREAAEAELAKVREAFAPGGLLSAAAENLRSADHDDRHSESAFRIAYQLDALRAALAEKTV